MIRNLGQNYSPLYFLASLGAGGLAVSFYMYIFFMLPHAPIPLATADHIYPAIVRGNLASGFIALDILIILALALLHFRLLFWNMKEYALYKKTAAFQALKNSNNEVALMAIPLTWAMTVNVCFVLGAAFVPRVWNYVEWLFPFALAGFLAVGVYAMKLFLEYGTRILSQKSFDFVNNNNLSQMIAIFAFSMIGVGFAAPGAMSHSKIISALGLFMSVFFSTISVSLIILKVTIGFKSILEHGISREGSVSLWIMIPIMTLLGITFIRYAFGFAHNFDNSQGVPGSWLFLLTSSVVSLQIMFGLFGYSTMKNLNYFNDFIHGEAKSVVSYAIICPGVAFVVFGFFFINYGLVANNLLTKLSPAYFAVMLPYGYIQIKTLLIMLKLNRKMLNGAQEQPVA